MCRLKIFIGLMLSFAVGQQTVFAAESIQAAALAIHNQLRSDHHAPKLVWDDGLQAFAERHANACVFQHSSPHPYGENLAAGFLSVTDAIRGWYSEEAQYSYWWPGFSMKTGHFTQLVWVATKKVGCAAVACNGRNGTPGTYLVCEYSPAGNINSRSYFRENVLPAS